MKDYVKLIFAFGLVLLIFSLVDVLPNLDFTYQVLMGVVGFVMIAVSGFLWFRKNKSGVP